MVLRCGVAVADVRENRGLVFAMFSAVMQLETYNSLNAFFATIPGSHKLNRRRQLITTSNYADYSFLYTLDTGEVFNKHLGKEYLAVFETDYKTPYYFNLHQEDVAHTVITGATGTGNRSC